MLHGRTGPKRSRIFCTWGASPARQFVDHWTTMSTKSSRSCHAHEQHIGDVLFHNPPWSKPARPTSANLTESISANRIVNRDFKHLSTNAYRSQDEALLVGYYLPGYVSSWGLVDWPHADFLKQVQMESRTCSHDNMECRAVHRLPDIDTGLGDVRS